MQNKKLTVLLLIALSFIFKFAQAQPTDVIVSYIAKYKDLAIAEMQRSGVPAAITLAQGIHETEAGTSVLVKKSNNHFGIKCKDNWTGESVSHDDDSRGECFRKYDDPSDSYKDHSDFLRSRPNYASLFKLDPTDYEAWAYGLKKAGYATNPRYPQILIKLINDYNLEQYTLIALGKSRPQDEMLVKNQSQKEENKTEAGATVVNNQKTQQQTTDVIQTVAKQTVVEKTQVVPQPQYPSGEFKINETRVVFVKKGESFLAVAQQYEIPLARIFEFNDMKPEEVAPDDQLIFLQRKRKTGDHEFHIVQPGETVYSIAQSEAIRIESLEEYNFLNANLQPAAGETIFLRSKAAAAPRLADMRNAVAEKTLLVAEQSIAVNNSKQVQTSQNQNNPIVHIVQPKETVYSIAKKYNVSFDDVVNWNRLPGHDLKIGQSLKIYK
jgi:LysM repeat protein